MDIFPAQYSTLSSTALSTFIAENYGLTDTRCRLLIHNVSDTYLVECAAGKFIFRVYRNAHRKHEEIRGEIELLDILKSRDAKVSYPLASLSGSKIQAFNAAEGTRHGVLFSYAQGRVVMDMSDEQLMLLGRAIAEMHHITSAITLKHNRISFNTDTTIIAPLEKVKPAFAELQNEYEYLTATAAKVIDALKKFDYQNFSYGFCHYDLLPKNFHFDDAGNITLFDFDFAGQGYLANDLMTVYIHFFMEAIHQKITKNEAERAFNVVISGYRELRPIHDDELRAIPYLGFGFWIFYLGFQYENFDDWSNSFFGPRFLKERTALIKKWCDWTGAELLS